MQEMIDLLASLREDEAAPTSAETVRADVARARRARARRRWRTAGTGVAAAVVAAAVIIGAGGGQGVHPAVASNGPSAAAEGQQTLSVQLAAYAGAQPAGFTVTTVPAHWNIRSSDAFAFVVEPPRGSAGGPSSHVAGDFENAITVMLQGDSSGPTFDVTKVTVNGRPGTLGLTRDRISEWLVYADGAGHHVLVQVPVVFHLGDGRTAHLTKEQILQFAAGVTVTGAAQPGVG